VKGVSQHEVPTLCEPTRNVIFKFENKKNSRKVVYFTFRNVYSGCPPFGEDEIQGLFQDFQGPFSVNSKT
jgi:hypothetical protein